MSKHSDVHDAAYKVFSRAAERGLVLRAAEDEHFSGRTITLSGRELLQFGSCSYMGLETDPRLQEGAIDALRRYGTQFSSSRAYVSAPLYPELEALLGEIFGLEALVTPSSTLAHAAAIPVLVGPQDAVILDQQVHATVQMAVNHPRAHGVPVELLRHNRLDLLESRIEALSRHHRHVWYMVDGIYSMYGDRAPMSELKALLDRHEQLHLYVDDAHGMGWIGKHGRGFALDDGPVHPRMVVATSFAKSFGTGGGALLVPDAAMRRKIRTIGSSFVFSGPLQPATLGAAIASATIHLSDALPGMQDELHARIRFCNQLCRQYGLPLVSEDLVPIRFIGTGLSSVTFEVVERLMKEGFYCNVGAFPAVPMQRAGIRFTLTRHQSMADIARFVSAIARHLPDALAREGSSIAAVEKAFKLTPAAPTELVGVVPESVTLDVYPGLALQHERTIEAMDAAEWDGLLGANGSFGRDGLRLLESAYCGHAAPEHNWGFHYFVVRDTEGTPVLATFFTEALWKDDMLASAAVSEWVEAERATEPYFLTSKVLAMGSLLTEGEHLYLDRTKDWRGALALLMQALRRVQAECGANQLVFRDLAPDDAELEAHMLDQGFARFEMPESFVHHLDFADDQAYWASLSGDDRRMIRRKVLPWNEAYDVEVLDGTGRRPGPEELAHFEALYRNVKARNLGLNTFELPPGFFERALETPGWEIVLLHARPVIGGEAGAPPVGFSVNFNGAGHYVPLVAGLDYHHVTQHGLYRQLLWQNLQRARQQGAQVSFSGFGAPIEKKRLGARPRQLCGYLQAADLYQMQLLEQLSMTVRVEAAHRRPVPTRVP
jgi:7-keto-8-aminopelargonate synthetase-like enzyme